MRRDMCTCDMDVTLVCGMVYQATHFTNSELFSCFTQFLHTCYISQRTADDSAANPAATAA
jgi:hypothetical protein